MNNCGHVHDFGLWSKKGFGPLNSICKGSTALWFRFAVYGCRKNLVLRGFKFWEV